MGACRARSGEALQEAHCKHVVDGLGLGLGLATPDAAAAGSSSCGTIESTRMAYRVLSLRSAAGGDLAWQSKSAMAVVRSDVQVFAGARGRVCLLVQIWQQLQVGRQH